MNRPIRNAQRLIGNLSAFLLGGFQKKKELFPSTNRERNAAYARIGGEVPSGHNYVFPVQTHGFEVS